MTTFGARLHEALRARGPLCAGIDPHAALLHDPTAAARIVADLHAATPDPTID